MISGYEQTEKRAAKNCPVREMPLSLPRGYAALDPLERKQNRCQSPNFLMLSR